MQNGDEAIGGEDLAQALSDLVGERQIHKALKDVVTADDFASDLLGFEECEDAEEEAAPVDANGQAAAGAAEISTLKKIAEAGPDEEGV